MIAYGVVAGAESSKLRLVRRLTQPLPSRYEITPPKSTGSGRSEFLPSDHPALDHFQSCGPLTRPRRTGLAWRYSIIARITFGSVALRSKPPPVCQKRLQGEVKLSPGLVHCIRQPMLGKELGEDTLNHFVRVHSETSLAKPPGLVRLMHSYGNRPVPCRGQLPGTGKRISTLAT